MLAPPRVDPGVNRQRRKRRSPSLAVLGIATLVLVGAVSWLAWQRYAAFLAGADATGPGPRTIAPPAQRALPPAMQPAYREILQLQSQRKYLEAAEGHRALFDQLRAAWGPTSPDLAPYIYNLGLALQLGGRLEESLQAAAVGQEIAPDYIALQLLDVTTRARQAGVAPIYGPAANAAFERLLTVDNYPLLRGVGVEPQALFTQWADLLLKSGRAPQALKVAARCAEIAPADRGCRELRARALLSTGEVLEAIPILESLVEEDATALVQFNLGVAMLESGNPQRAWDLLSDLMDDRPQGYAIGPDWASAGSLLTLKAAHALNELGRHAEAVRLLVRPHITEPERPELLQQLTAAAWGLSADAAAEALIERSRELAPCADLRNQEFRARQGGDPRSQAYYGGQIRMVADQAGPALTLLEQGIHLGPGSVELALEQSRVLELLGMTSRAVDLLRSFVSEHASPLAAAELARLLSLRGEQLEARTLLERALSQNRDLEENDPSAWQRARATLGAARALMILGDPAAARELLDRDALGERDPEELRLCRAELAYRGGDAATAIELARGDVGAVTNGRLWASALQTLAPLEEGAALADPFDPSDLIDTPGLLNVALARMSARDSRDAAAEATRQQLEMVAALRQRRAPLIERQEWEALFSLYVEYGAHRKARELGWYLTEQRPDDADAARMLVRALDRDADVIARLGAALRAIEIAPDDPDLLGVINQSWSFLGVDDAVSEVPEP
jgi:tetratricopeptide (TPR) repeat protein